MVDEVYDRDALLAEKQRLREQVKRLRDEWWATIEQEKQIEQRLTPPSVVVVTAIWRHHSRELEELDLGSTLRDAVGPLWGAEETGTGSAEGAYVGGAFVSYEELESEFGTPEDWDRERADGADVLV